jgi:hypothetical protein
MLEIDDKKMLGRDTNKIKFILTSRKAMEQGKHYHQHGSTCCGIFMTTVSYLPVS